MAGGSISLDTGRLQIDDWALAYEPQGVKKTSQHRHLSEETGQDILVFYLMHPLELNPLLVSTQSPFKFTIFLPDQLVTE